jgi:phospholipid/cholesterol/gamma-HCH transport system substrate-binding protein
MNKAKNHSLKLGIFVAVGLGLFIIAIYYLGSQQNLFSSSVTVKAYFNTVSGLVEGNKVRYSGISIGTVSNIEIVSDSSIQVEMTVDEKVRKFIRKNSKVEISTDGLMGSKIINILPGTEDAGSVSENDVLATSNPLDLQDILVEAKKMIDDGRTITKNIIAITEKVEHGDGDLAVLLNDNGITTRLNKVGDQMMNTMGHVNQIASKINDGKGDLGKLVNDTILTTELTQVVRRVNDIADKSDSITTELHQFSKALNSGNGIVSRLVYDVEMADLIDTTIVKVNDGVENVVKAAQTIEKSWIFNLFSKKK